MNEYNEQAVETLDEAGSIIANKNSMIDGLTQKLAEAGEMIDYWIEHCESRHRDAETLKQQLTAAEARIKELEAELTKAFTRHRAIYEQGRAAAQAHNVRLWESSEKLVKAMSGTQAESDFAFQMFMLEEALRDQTGTDALEDYVMQRLGEPVAYRHESGLITASDNDYKAGSRTPLYALKEEIGKDKA